MTIPEFKGRSRSHFIRVPTAIQECNGIVILNRHIRSVLFSTDVAIIRNTNADAVIAVYPFTPQPIISHAIIMSADVPVLCGVGGGLTSSQRTLDVALDAEFQGAHGVVLNKPAPNALIAQLKKTLEIPVIVTVVSEKEDIAARIDAGTDIFNVSGARDTAQIVRTIRSIHERIPIIATGGPSNETIRNTIQAGANAITHTPPTAGSLFKVIMDKYRESE